MWAIGYCNKLSIKEGLAPAYTVSGITDWESLAYSDIPASSDSAWNAATCNFEANGAPRIVAARVFYGGCCFLCKCCENMIE